MDTNRRGLLLGGLAVAGGLAGCLEETRGGDETASAADTDDGDAASNASTDDDAASDAEAEESDDVDGGDGVPEAARAAGEETIAAVAAGDIEAAIDDAPVDVIETRSRDDWADDYEGVWKPESTDSIAFADGDADEELAAGFDDRTATDVTTAYRLEYDVAFEARGERYDRSVTVAAVRIDGDWNTWIGEWFTPSPEAAVDVDAVDPTTVAITLTSRDDPATVFVRGGGIDDPTDYRLADVGDTLTVTADDAGSGSFEVVASIEGPDSETATTLETFSLVDPSGWTDVEEIVLDGRTVNWVGVEPEPIEGVENPTLVLRDGKEYRITARNGNSTLHTFMLRDENDAVVDDHETSLIEQDEQRQLTVTATDDLASYACEPHEPMMYGDIVVVDSFEDEG